jgi:hypothetical protein
VVAPVDEDRRAGRRGFRMESAVGRVEGLGSPFRIGLNLELQIDVGAANTERVNGAAKHEEGGAEEGNVP